MKRNRMGGGKTKGWKWDRGEVRGRDQRGLEEERGREMSPREVRLSWEQRKGQGGWARGGWRNAEEGRAEAAASEWEMQLQGDRQSGGRSWVREDTECRETDEFPPNECRVSSP